MSCEFTEEVSLLVDGELPPRDAARLSEHIEGCAGCKQARESFLLLRQELRSYERTPDPQAQSNALASILGSRARDAESAAPSIANRPSTVSGWWERLSEAFSVRRLRPAHVAALAMLLIATALGLRWLAGSNTSDGLRRPEAPALANANSRPVQPETAAEDGEKKSKESDAVDRPTVHQAEPQTYTHLAGAKPKSRVEMESARASRDVRRTNRERREDLNGGAPRETARVTATTPQPSTANAPAPYADGGLRAAADDPALRVGRHAERVERLLRSFRNSRVTDNDPTLDVADARRLSKRLLYINIALRREAESAGDLPVEGLLDSVEPILIDIANLPNSPSQDAVGSIKERISRRQLVGVLQTRGALASR
jgi:anti-sigma factor RsiW